MQAMTATAETLRGPPGLPLGAGINLPLQLTTLIVFGDAGEFLEKVQPLLPPSPHPSSATQAQPHRSAHRAWSTWG